MTNVDFAPTICDLLNITAPEQWDGTSQKTNVLGNETAVHENVIWESSFWAIQRAVRSKTHLYLHTYDPHEFTNRTEAELYDIVNDPHQIKNIAEDFPNIVEVHENVLSKWVDEQKTKNGNHDSIDEALKERHAYGVFTPVEKMLQDTKWRKDNRL